MREKEQLRLEKRIFPRNMFYKVIGLFNAIWWLFRVDENTVINTKSSEEINMNYCSEIILIDPNIFQPLSSNYWPMFQKVYVFVL